MSKVIEMKRKNALKVVPGERHFSYVKLHWEPGYEAHVRRITTEHGDNDTLPQDKLIYAFITMNPVTGCAAEFGWASGRRDTWVVADISVEALVFSHDLARAEEIITERNEFIASLKEQYHDQGFEHGGSGTPDEYEGGFAEFAQNFERATGRRVSAVVAGLCRGELRASA